ncbi:MAG: regulatory protein RecX [Anaerolineales bacterium]|nr:regulatory protein RecX [Anaerolineales bacterium]
MPKRIAALRAGRDGRRITVVLEGGESFPLSAGAAAAFSPGQLLAPGELDRLKQQSALDDSYARCLGLLARRPRSRAEFERYLRRRKMDAAEISLVLDRLTGQGWIDDRKFAREWVANRQEFRPRSALALRMELRRLGLAEDDAREALEGVREDAAAQSAARKKAPRLMRASGEGPDASREFQRKMTAFLASRGFNYGLARETARCVWEEFSRSGQAEPKIEN